MNNSKYNFLYRDTLATENQIAKYEVEQVLYEDAGLTATFLSGGLLTDCNLRTLITLEIGNQLKHASTDPQTRGIYTFDLSYEFQVLDIYKIGDYCQILITPDYLEQDLKEEVTLAARKDFNKLINTPPIAVLNTREWRRRVKRLVGNNRKRFDHCP